MELVIRAVKGPVTLPSSRFWEARRHTADGFVVDSRKHERCKPVNMLQGRRPTHTQGPRCVRLCLCLHKLRLIIAKWHQEKRQPSDFRRGCYFCLPCCGEVLQDAEVTQASKCFKIPNVVVYIRLANLLQEGLFVSLWILIPHSWLEVAAASWSLVLLERSLESVLPQGYEKYPTKTSEESNRTRI